MTYTAGPCLCGDPLCPRCFPRSPARTRRIVIRWTPEEAHDIQRAAMIEGETVSDYIRRAVEARMTDEPGQGEGRGRGSASLSVDAIG